MAIKDVNIISPTYNQLLSQFEFDTVRIFIHWSNLENYDLKYLKKLTNAQNIINRYNTSDKYKGNYKGFTILIANKGITIVGSFSNYYLGYQKFLPHSKLKDAVGKLSFELNLDLANAKLYRVDVNFNIITDKKTEKYTNNLFLDLPRFKRIEQDDGVKFRTGSKELVFYNKSLELFEKRGIKAEKLYRIEFRILKNVKKHTGLIYLKDLYNVKNYHSILTQFFELFKKMKKQSLANINQSEFNSVKAFQNHLLALGIISFGGEKEIFRTIEQFDRNKIFKNRNQKSRLRKNMKSLIDNTYQKKLNPLVREISDKFEKAYNSQILQKITQNNYYGR